MLNYINKHKGLSIVIGLSFILFIILLIIFISLFIGSGEGKYGNRLEGIDDVKLTDSFLKETENKLKDDESIKDASIRLQGKIIYIKFEVNSDVSNEVAKQIANNILESFSDEEKKYYDISYIISRVVEKENDEGEKTTETSVIEGTKHPQKDSISWIKS